MAGASGDGQSFYTTLSLKDIGEDKVYIRESGATTFFGYPSNASGGFKVDLNFYAQGRHKEIGLCRDGDNYYYFNRGCSQFASMMKLKLSAGDIITFNKIKPRGGNTENTEFNVGVLKNK